MQTLPTTQDPHEDLGAVPTGNANRFCASCRRPTHYAVCFECSRWRALRDAIAVFTKSYP
jgi:hypothetical protein